MANDVLTNTLYCADCLEWLPRIETGSVDLIFADPPFNKGKAYKDKRANYKEWCEAWIVECFRVLKDTGSFYLMTLDEYLEWKMPIMAGHGVFINQIHWRNVSSSHSKRRFWGAYQPILLYGKTKDYTFHTYAETEDTGHRRWGGYSTEYRGQLKDMWEDIPFCYAGSIYHKEAIIAPGTNRKAHPCQMPEKLAARPIKFSTDPGDIVLDPFFGSGTVPVVAAKLNRRFMGCEIEQKFCEIALSRFESDMFLDFTSIAGISSG